MAFYDDIPCPVCGVPFTPDDDVVVCPDCGAPHHRACWAKDNRCAHTAEHAAGFQFKRPAAVKLAPESAPAEQTQAAAPQTTAAQCPACGFSYDAHCTFCPQCGLRRQTPAPPTQANAPNVYGSAPFYMPHASVYSKQDNVKIEGEALSDVAAAVGIGAPHYIPVFLKQEEKKKKTGWNWCAFFFGGFWLMGRKCYRAGVFALLAQLAILLPFNLLLAPQRDALYRLAADVKSYADLATPDILQLYQEMAPYLLAQAALLFALHFLLGLFGNYIYKNKALQIVKQERPAYEAALQSPGTGIYATAPMAPQDLYYALLSRRGGMNLFAAAGSVMLYQIVGSLFITLLGS